MATSRKLPRRVYANPPIVEASFAIEFEPGQEWDITLPGRVYEKLRHSYPSRPSALRSDDPRGEGDIGGARIQLGTDDGLHQIRFREDALSVHVFRPYPGWEAFYSRIREAVDSFIKVAEPKGVSRLDLRYKNRIDIEGDQYIFSDYFTIGTQIPGGIPRLFTSFSNSIVAPYDDKRSIYLSIYFASVPPPDSSPEALSSRLDIEVSRNHIHEPLTLRSILTTIRNMKSRESDAFEALITDRTRELFG